MTTRLVRVVGGGRPSMGPVGTTLSDAQAVVGFLADVRPSPLWLAHVVLGAADVSRCASHPDVQQIVRDLTGAGFLHWLHAHYPASCRPENQDGWIRTEPPVLVVILLVLHDEYRAAVQARPCGERN